MVISSTILEEQKNFFLEDFSWTVNRIQPTLKCPISSKGMKTLGKLSDLISMASNPFS